MMLGGIKAGGIQCFPGFGPTSMENLREFGQTPYLGVQWKLHLAGLHQRVVATFLRFQ
jgi:hypothetical protein